MNKPQVFEEINARIIANLEEGNLSWRQPWKAGLPANYISRKMYQGLNFLFLSFDTVSNPYYLTFLQAQQKGLHIKRGSKGRLITFYKLHDFDSVTESGEISTRHFPLLKVSYVFNLEDMEEYEKPEPILSAPLEVLSLIRLLHNPDIRHNMGSCFYSPKENFIATPAVDTFGKEEEYFSALFHELIHWSGHPSRLNRTKFQKWGDEAYAFEELIAEIGASYLLGMCGIQNTLDNATGYIAGWLKKAKSDNSYIATASIQAQKAVNYLINPEAAH